MQDTQSPTKTQEEVESFVESLYLGIREIIESAYDEGCGVGEMNRRIKAYADKRFDEYYEGAK